MLQKSFKKGSGGRSLCDGASLAAGANLVLVSAQLRNETVTEFLRGNASTGARSRTCGPPNVLGNDTNATTTAVPRISA